MKRPWPSILRTTYGYHERFKLNYFTTYPGLYFSGDGALKDEAGNFRITGRVDDVLNVSGHRIGTAEVENAINMHTNVIESAVVGYPHNIKGQGISDFGSTEKRRHKHDGAKTDVLKNVSRIICPIAKTDQHQFISGHQITRRCKIIKPLI